MATAIAEWFRDRGQRVLLLMDSLTRFARAQREVGLAAGEPPVRHGFPPSVFGLLPRLLERAGNAERGSLTALYTVLVAGKPETADTAKGRPAHHRAGPRPDWSDHRDEELERRRKH